MGRDHSSVDVVVAWLVCDCTLRGNEGEEKMCDWYWGRTLRLQVRLETGWAMSWQLWGVQQISH